MSTKDIARPRRSLLYVPASNQRAVDKARSLPCDGVILDLEDSVAPGEKSAARDAAMAAVAAGGFGHRELIVRVNGLDTEWGHADLSVVSGSRVDAVLVPKVRSRSDVLAYDAALRNAAPRVRLWTMIETAMGALKIEEIAATVQTSRLAGFVMGTNDLAKELRMPLAARRVPMAALLCLSVTAARAHGLFALDGVYNAFNDEAGFEAQCREGVEYGFDGKTLIHPRQIATCNALFAPAPGEIEWARKIMSAFADPANVNKGVINVEGAMIERLHLAQAEQLLEVHAAISKHTATTEKSP